MDYASYTGYGFSTATFKVDTATNACPGSLHSTTLDALLPNTTYFVRTYALDEELLGAELSNGATAPTLARPAALAAETFLGVFQSSITADWVALPNETADVSSMSAEGYRLEASSTNFGALSPGGQVFTSATLRMEASTLTLTGLATDVTYYFRLATLNWNSAPDFLSLGSTKTVTFAGAPPNDTKVFRVYAGSVTMSWVSVNSQNGYEVLASTAANFSGTLYSSATPNGDMTQLTVSSLDTNTTYYLKAGAIWGQTTSYAQTHSTSTLAPFVTGTAFPGNVPLSATLN